MNPASAAATAAAAPLVWGPYTSALFVDAGAFDALYGARPLQEPGTGEEVFSGHAPADVFREVSPALTQLLPQLEERGFSAYGLGKRFQEIANGERSRDDFLDTFGKSLAVFGADHPEEYRGALRAAVNNNPFPKLHIEAGNLDAFVRLTNWKARKERELFWKRAGVEEEKNGRAARTAATMLTGGVSAVAVGCGMAGFVHSLEVLPSLEFAGWIVAILGVVTVGVGVGKLARGVRDSTKLMKEIVSPEVSPVFPEFLPAESRHNPDIVGKLFSGQLKHWISTSIQGGASAR